MDRRLAAVALFAILALPSAAGAHTGIGPTTGFAAGFLHPLTGADHLLAMLAVGLLAFAVGGRAMWLLPASFVVTIAVGGILGGAGLTLPGAERMLAASVVVIAGLATTGFRPPLALLAPLIAGFALFHGLAHGAEAPTDASGLAYGAGFLTATALLHALGLGGAALATSLPGRLAAGPRLAAAAMSVVGLALLVVRL